jgi:pre-mRNA-splicing factor ISY1
VFFFCRYFGRARELPGVKELLEQAPPVIQQRVTKNGLYKNIDADYYGYRDEDDGEVVRLERLREAEIGVDAAQLEPFANYESLTNHQVPSQKEVEEYLLRRRKEELLEKFNITT